MQVRAFLSSLAEDPQFPQFPTNSTLLKRFRLIPTRWAAVWDEVNIAGIVVEILVALASCVSLWSLVWCVMLIANASTAIAHHVEPAAYARHVHLRLT